jgi:hypothetical protein
MDRLTASARVQGRWLNVATASGSPLVRFTGDRKDMSLAIGRPREGACLASVDRFWESGLSWSISDLCIFSLSLS